MKIITSKNSVIQGVFSMPLPGSFMGNLSLEPKGSVMLIHAYTSASHRGVNVEWQTMAKSIIKNCINLFSLNSLLLKNFRNINHVFGPLRLLLK